LQQAFLGGITHWADGNNIDYKWQPPEGGHNTLAHKAIRAQNKIGWKGVTKGFYARQWNVSYETLKQSRGPAPLHHLISTKKDEYSPSVKGELTAKWLQIHSYHGEKPQLHMMCSITYKCIQLREADTEFISSLHAFFKNVGTV
jgi:hypothetical protein